MYVPAIRYATPPPSRRRPGTAGGGGPGENPDRDRGGAPLGGKPLRQRWRNFRPSVDGYVVSLGGPLPYMTRLREIEALTEEHLRGLEVAWRGLAAECAGDGARGPAGGGGGGRRGAA